MLDFGQAGRKWLGNDTSPTAEPTLTCPPHENPLHGLCLSPPAQGSPGDVQEPPLPEPPTNDATAVYRVMLSPYGASALARQCVDSVSFFTGHLSVYAFGPGNPTENSFFFALRVCADSRALRMGGSGKRSLPMARGICVNAIGKLRRLRLPLPPAAFHVERTGSRLLDDRQPIFTDTALRGWTPLFARGGLRAALRWPAPSAGCGIAPAAAKTPLTAACGKIGPKASRLRRYRSPNCCLFMAQGALDMPAMSLRRRLPSQRIDCRKDAR